MPVIRASVPGTLQRLTVSWLSPATLSASSALVPKTASATARDHDRRAAIAGESRPRSPAGADEGERRVERARGLDRDRGDERRRRRRPGRALKTSGDREHASSDHQRVVVGAADGVDEDQRVERDERGGGARVDAAERVARRAVSSAIPATESAAIDLQRPERRRDAERAERVAEQREQRPVDGDGVAEVLDPHRRLVGRDRRRARTRRG